MSASVGRFSPRHLLDLVADHILRDSNATATTGPIVTRRGGGSSASNTEKQGRFALVGTLVGDVVETQHSAHRRASSSAGDLHRPSPRSGSDATARLRLFGDRRVGGGWQSPATTSPPTRVIRTELLRHGHASWAFSARRPHIPSMPLHCWTSLILAAVAASSGRGSGPQSSGPEGGTGCGT